MEREIYRILDAAANRGREALRVIEDVARFLADSEALARRVKDARHRFASVADRLNRRARIEARDPPGDVGVAVEAEGEYRRNSLESVFVANFARLQESLRSLEEFSKVVEPSLARDWERLRYKSYALEKEVFTSLFAEGGASAE